MNKYNIKIENQIYDLIKKENLTFEDIAKKLNINYDDLKEYINKSSKKYKKSLVKKIRKAKDEYFLDAKIKIENALIKKASGYYSKDIVIEIKTDKEGKESKTKKIVYKYNPPSERAVIVFFEILKNRKNKRLEREELKRKVQEEENRINIRVGFDN
ncbi:hypothetical protein Q5M87_08110 [Brachyspira innocens]|uniref:Uncharacterized protein n=1 Tax=Brachyspira innocens TaxID=13264 RepID=A0ABT8YWG1_9SPIR|nr:hypothetical protein [Brachyspira innocens]MDO6993975.1 hypothetical protein [Brachyspira innocens]MDO7019951.1 hypothetical protein [Brachyspira innocens]